MDKTSLRGRILDLVEEYYHLCNSSSEEFRAGVTKIHYAGRVYDAHEMHNLVDSSLEFWLTAGSYARRFESRMAEMFQARRFLLVNSGSSANLLMVSSLCASRVEGHLSPGDEIITPAVTFPTTVAPIVQNGLIPVFVDCEIGTYNINTSLLDEALGERTRGIFIPHTLGNPCNMDAIVSFAQRKGLFVLEDCCDALGARFRGKLTGTFGSMASLSFYPAHHITTGEGGGIIVNDERFSHVTLSMRDWGRDCWCEPGEEDSCGERFEGERGDLPAGYDHKYVYGELGYNLKATDMQAAIGLAQLDKLHGFIKARNENFEFYYNALKKFEDRVILPRWEKLAEPSWFGFPITTREGISANALIRHMEKNRIETRKIFAGNILRQPCFEGIKYRVGGGLENTDAVMRDSFFIGVYPGLTADMREYVAEKLIQFLRL